MSGLRRIEVAGQVEAMPAGAAPMPRMVALADLRIDGSWQRDLRNKNWRAVRAIAREFDWRLFGVLVIGEGAEGLVVVDGQHRAHAAALCGLTEVPALVMPMERAEAARAFTALNRARINVTPLHAYFADLVAGDEDAVALDAILGAAGCRMRRHGIVPTLWPAGDVICAGLLRGFVRDGLGSVVAHVLGGLRRSAVADVPEHWQSGVLKPLLQAVAADQRNMRVDIARLAEDVDLPGLAEDARARCKAVGRPATDIAREAMAGALAALRERRAA